MGWRTGIVFGGGKGGKGLRYGVKYTRGRKGEDTPLDSDSGYVRWKGEERKDQANQSIE